VSGSYIQVGGNEQTLDVCHAGCEILNLVKDEVFVKLMGMKKLLQNSKQGAHGNPSVGIIIKPSS
jgi:hypothetical protein